jgi:Tol biopolymer transport system component
MQVSPDGNSLAISDPDKSGRSDVWLYDLTRAGVRRRFTFDAAADGSAIWTPDGATIVWRSNRKNPGDLFLKPSNGTGADELLFEDTHTKTPMSISPDGNVLLFTSPSTSPDIWALPLDSAQSRQPWPVVHSPFADTDPQFHPAGHWIAYSSAESGRSEVYVTPYPGPGGKLQVSTATGVLPHWRRDGKELFYVTQSGDLMAAEILMKDGGLRVGSAERLFGGILIDRGYLYAPAADGKRFIVAQDTSPAGSPPLTLIQNWQALLKR